MTRVVGVRWRKADPVSYAKAGDFSLPINSYVVMHWENLKRWRGSAVSLPSW